MAMRLLPACPALVVIAASLVVGCGGGAKAEDPPGGAEVRQAFARFDAAQASGDAQTACRSLVAVDEQGRVEVPGGEAERAREAKAATGEDADAGVKESDADAGVKEPDADAAAKDGTAQDAPTGDAAVCERAFTHAATSRRELQNVTVEVTKVTVAGDKATIATRARLTRADGSRLDQAATRRLVRLEGRWRVVITEE